MTEGAMSVSDEELLAEIRRLAEELGHPPTINDMRNYGEHSVTTYYNHFGSWRDSVAAAGFEPHDPETSVPESDLIDELQRLADELGERPSPAHMNAKGEYWVSTFRNHFGSWSAALEEAGFESWGRNPVPEDVLIEELQSVADELGETPSESDVREHGDFSPRTFYRRFGSWHDALDAAGLEPKQSATTYTEAELLEELHRLADELGHHPSTYEMDEYGAIHSNSFYRRWGSWSAALEEAFDTDD